MNSSASLAIDASLNPARQEIRILSDVIVDQIAAGEVVERPASVVKELVENSIDAGATTVTVVLGNGGHASLEVIDDGLGMTEAEARVAVQRFGTSKISTIDDLQSIATFGFRGEALPSIAAVSRFSLSTCARSPDAKPVQLDIEGGKLLHVGSSAVASGTRITVSQLFYNTPARRKFLRSPRTEIGVVRTLMLDFAAAYPSIRFTLVADGEELLSLPSESTFQSRARSLRLAGDDPLELDQIVLAPAGNYHLTGFLSKPRDAAAGANKLRLLVNGRSVRDRLLLRAVRDAFGNFLRGDRYPVGILRLSLPPEDLDVNVHPQKTEVRFRSPEYIFRVVHRALRTAFDGAGLVSPALSPMAPLQTPRRDATQAEIAWFPPAASIPRVADADDIPDYRLQAPDSLSASVISPARQTSSDAPRQAPNYSNLRYVGQVFQCYLLLEGSDTLFLVDMHAAHERVTHARLRQQIATAGISRQMLLLPEILRLDPSEAELYRGNADLIAQLGFDVEELAPGEIVVRAVPALLAHTSPVKMLTDLLVGFEGDPVVEIEKRIDYAIARLACHASVRSGKSMNREEVGALMDALSDAECGGFCPHGRPVMCSVSEQEFESMFGRSE